MTKINMCSAAINSREMRIFIRTNGVFAEYWANWEVGSAANSIPRKVLLSFYAKTSN